MRTAISVLSNFGCERSFGVIFLKLSSGSNTKRVAFNSKKPGNNTGRPFQNVPYYIE